MEAREDMLFGIDVSKWQGGHIDWAKVRKSGIQFMLARASLATTKDPFYRTNIAGAKDAGMPVIGAYHFLYPARVVSPVDQARLFVERLGNAEGLLTMLDVETDRNSTTHEVFMPVIADVRAFAAEFARLTDGHPLIMYAPGWYWRGHIGNPKASDLGPLNQSHYVDVTLDQHKHIIPMPPAVAFAKARKEWWDVKHGGWKRATFLQFTSSGKVPGCPGRVDVNAFDGTIEALKRLTTASTPAPAAAVAPGAAAAPVAADPVAAAAPAVVAAPSVAEPDVDPPAGPQPVVPRFYTVVAGDTLFDIAEEFGFEPRHGQPGYRVLIDAFPENARYRAKPDLINPGDRVRVR